MSHVEFRTHHFSNPNNSKFAKKKKKKGWTMVKALVLGSKNLLQVTLEFDNKLQNEIYKKYICPNYRESASECVSIVNMY